MRAPLPHLTALTLGVAAALAVGCGGSNLIPPDDAAALKDSLASVQQAVNAGRCNDARSAFQDAVAANGRLPVSVDPRLRRRLLQGLASLGDHLVRDCLAARVPTVPTDTTTTTTATETVATQTTATETTTTAAPTTPTTTAPTDTTPTTPTDTTTEPVPPDTGGAPGDGTATP